MLEYKSVPFEVREIVDVSGGGWEIAGYASTWWGTPDAYGDVIAPGAFKESIASRPTKFLYEHQVPIGRQLEIREDERGLFGRWSVVDTTTGTDAYKLAKSGVLDSLSIGYVTEDAEFRDDGVRVLKQVSLFEVSAVAIPANVNAVITDIKADAKKAIASHSTETSEGAWDAAANWRRCPQSASALKRACAWVDPDGPPDAKSSYRFIHHEVDADGSVGPANLTACSAGIGVLNGGRGGTTIPSGDRAGVYRHLARHLSDAGREPPALKSADELFEIPSFEVYSDDTRIAVAEWLGRVKAGSDLRAADKGEPLSEARRQLLAEMSGSLKAAADEIDALLTPPSPAERLNVGWELRRRRLIAAGILERPT